jgi:hypothetical protein
MDTNELYNQNSAEGLKINDSMKIGLLVRTTIKKIVSSNSISYEKITQLLDGKYCKTTFEINYPLLKKVMQNSSFSQQRKVNGYDRYWEEAIMINGDRYFICNDWYEKNRPRFIRWVKDLII